MRYEFHHNEVTGFHEVLSRDIIKGKYHKWTRIDDNIENTIWTHHDRITCPFFFVTQAQVYRLCLWRPPLGIIQPMGEPN